MFPTNEELFDESIDMFDDSFRNTVIQNVKRYLTSGGINAEKFDSRTTARILMIAAVKDALDTYMPHEGKVKSAINNLKYF